MRARHLFVLAAVVAGLGTGGAARVTASPNLVTNGDFETATYDPNEVPGPNGYSAVTVPGWIVTGTPTVIAYGSLRPVPSPCPVGTTCPAFGAQSLGLNSGAPATISQDLATTAGTTYHVSFALSGDAPPSQAGCPDDRLQKTLTVGAGASSYDFTFDPDPNADPQQGLTFAMEEFDFVATTSTTTLSLRSTTPGCAGPIVDAVSVTDVAPLTPAAPVAAAPAFTG